VIRPASTVGALPDATEASSPTSDQELFRSRLENIADARHPLLRLAGTRLMVGLHLLKHSALKHSAQAHGMSVG
jgi:hypothetical protein